MKFLSDFYLYLWYNYYISKESEGKIMQVTATQPPSIQPVPQTPTYSNKEVYDASQGNVIRGESGDLQLTPQGETNLNNAKEEATTEAQAQTQAKRDDTRANAVDYLAYSSKKSQVEIYLAVASDSDDSTANIVSALRDVQKQNAAVEAYAQYQAGENYKPALN